METDFFSKSTLVTSSETVSMEDSLNHSRGRRSSLDLSVISALESLVRSMGGLGSTEIMVMAPVKSCSRRACTAPIAPLPPPTTTTFSWPWGLHLVLTDLLFALIVLSSPLMYTPPSFSTISNLAKGSRAGASSTSPEATLKQARTKGQYAFVR